MRKHIYRNEEVDNIILDESLLLSIEWIYKEHPIIEIKIDWCGQEDLKDEIVFLEMQTKLVFDYAGNIDFNFKHSGTWNSGALEITEFSYLKKGTMYMIEFKFDFSPVGYIRFNCADFYFEIIEENVPK
ncbi:hypothetical protein M2137_000692 [Parabacteroides sp. PFB2-10]|uniref:hypothetical protein n=1 Tax=Parabacteroides sp. PFB2-10 TaxID=1742405 RepID=UPI0024759F20|nr:hypothetical protein [Parabacteroides sp. PFB2-10]MDH6311933.1 hypothetical protein [Parabacteroides sp. PFB2-10]